MHRSRIPKTYLSFIVVWLLGLGGAEAAPEQAAASPFSPCRIPDLDPRARCATIEVPENPDRPDGRQLPIAVVVIPATGKNVLPDPIVPLMGGPGEAAIGVAAAFVERAGPLLQDRDLLLVDQRGTGRSAGLHCDFYAPDEDAVNLRDFFPLAAVRRCRAELESRADLTQYSYRHFADDLEHVRRALGYGPLNLFPGSYGTRAALHYLRAYPQSVRTLFMGSVVPLDVAIPLPLAKAAQSALEKTFYACAADAACHATFPNLPEEFRAIMMRLESGSVRVAIPGQAEAVPLARGRVAEWVRARLYRPEGAAILPWAIHRAYRGDWSPIVDDILAGVRERESEASFGLFFSIACNDDIAFLREEDIAPQSKGSFLGDYRVRQQQAACSEWPKSKLPENYREPVHSPVPTLFVSGDSDPASPLWNVARVAAGFPNRIELVVPGQGHTEWGECASKAYQALVRSGKLTGAVTQTCAAVPRPPFRLDESADAR